MSPINTAKVFIRYRTLAVALTNAGITWIILIIAPLGLFAVITCTALVFLGSLMTGVLSDRVLYFLLRASQNNIQEISPHFSGDSHRPPTPRSITNQLPRDSQRDLPDR